jgi:hypothetical protein
MLSLKMPHKPSKLQILLDKRWNLQTEAQLYRDHLVQHSNHWQQKLSLLDRIFTGVGFLRKHPLAMMAGMSLLTFFKPSSLIRIA